MKLRQTKLRETERWRSRETIDKEKNREREGKESEIYKYLNISRYLQRI